jgi:hypothetical protein
MFLKIFIMDPALNRKQAEYNINTIELTQIIL